MKHLPCKIEKCILFPICISEHVIDCNELVEWYEYYTKKRNVKSRTTWRAINNIFPKLQTIVGPLRRNNIPQSYYFQHNILNPHFKAWQAEAEL